MHDFTVTRNHSIFLDLPAVFDMEEAMNGGMPIKWSDDYPSRFGVMPRAGKDSDVKWFEIILIRFVHYGAYCYLLIYEIVNARLIPTYRFTKTTTTNSPNDSVFWAL